MSEDQPKKRLRDPYRLVLVKEETLEEVGSYKLSLLNVYILVSSAIVLMSLVVVALIFFTPVKRLVPGYANIQNNKEYVELYKKVQSLEEEVRAQDLYAQRFREIVLGGSVDSADIAAFKPDSGPPTRQNTLSDIDQGSLFPDLNANRGETVKSNWSDGDNIDFLYMIPPVKGPISARYNTDEAHFGIDVLAPKNTPIKSIMDGYVITSDWTLETGNTIGIQHANNMVTFYKHNARNLKQLGSFVKAGEAVAIIGNTGEQSSGPHLHFELWVDGKPVDPEGYIAF